MPTITSSNTTNGPPTSARGLPVGLPSGADWPRHHHQGHHSAAHPADSAPVFQEPQQHVDPEQHPHPVGHQPPSSFHQQQPPGPGPPGPPGPPAPELEHHRQHHQLLLHHPPHQPHHNPHQHPFAALYGPGVYNLPFDQFGFVPTTQPQLERSQSWPVSDPTLHSHVAAPPAVTQAPSATVYHHQQFPQEDAANLTKREARSPSSPLSKVPTASYPTQQQQQQQQQQGPSAGRTSESPMHTTQVAIISPQQQNSAPIPGTTATGAPRGTSQPTKSSRTYKKRSRDEVDDGKEAVEEEPAKKAKPTRGRPRLTGVGETPNERRRKQIREAQRAYRNRKDQAITDLEDKVKKLEEAKTVMTQEFSGFLQLLQSQGTAHANPEVSQRFQNLSQKYLPDAIGQPPRESDENSGASSTAAREKAPAQHHQRRHTMGTMSTASSDQYTPIPSTAQARPSLRGAPNSFASSATSFYPPEAMSYEVIAQPTPENASFPSYTPDPQAPGGWVEQPPMGQSLIPHGPHTAASYAPQEQTFGRRLHLTTLRRGLILAAMPSPPPNRFSAVFGFCLLYESREAIINRLVEQFQAVSQAPMDNWEALFPHPHGYDKRITELPGFEGEQFVDSEEVDTYLLRRGIHIPGSADFVEVELNPNEFAGAFETGTVPVNVAVAPVGQAAAPMQPAGMGHIPVSGMWHSQPAQTAAATSTADAITTMFTDGSATGATDTGAMNPFLCPAIPVGSWVSQSPPKFKATLNVSVLVEELIAKSVCLGYTSGLRPKDVDRAVKIATGLFRER